ncbi:DUF1223 domain-containing protein [Glaciimonas soli]|uniref:DUF1223 domain-containing protein n=1 Tax=Glaciimonas soli TaxID=2590999 RepID=UPI002AD36AA5|nr:DUF1223 domain-containing protein [Glaciimonas soli]
MSTFAKYTYLTPLLALLISVVPSTQAATYTAHSPANRVALLELYTSEGCSSCPPADAWLIQTGAQADPKRVIPLALHVDYWNSLGWKDRFSDRKFTTRQQELAAFVHSKVVYTPEVFVAGRELRRWSDTNDFDHIIKNITAQPSAADIEIKLSSGTTARSYDLSSNVKLRGSSPQGVQNFQTYIALYENKLVSNIAAGENSGVTLHHDYVVRQWLGPYPLKDGAANINENIALDKIQGGIKTGQFGVVVFVQNASNGEVLQALRLQPGIE